MKNFFEVSPLLAKNYTPSAIYNPNDPQEDAGRAAAMTEFRDFVAAADARGVNVMLDAPFNHTAYDGELAGSGAAYFSPGANPRALLRETDTRFYSRNANYCQRATLVSGQGPAVAPDRDDFGKFGDVYDVFFGRYSALVCQNPADNASYLNEGDIFFYQDVNWAGVDKTIVLDGQNRPINVTQNTWKYFSDYILFWLDQTGCPAGTSVADQAYKGIDGLRADFGQGLPPQCWEYLINKARSRKWSFVFMAESLDGGAVTYRSGRHFDVLNENIVFPFQQATTASAYRDIFEGRRSAYGQAMVLLNNTSHDEENYGDPYQALIRYLASSSVDGVPMVYMGQELGISRTFGYDRYETNFGKQIVHFKKYNSPQPILAPGNRTYALDQLYPVYSAAAQGRAFSRALRSSNRWFLDQTGGGGSQPQIFSVAKYETPNASPNFADVVFAFSNLDRDNNQQGNFNVAITQNGSNLFGIKAGRTYNVRNIAAYTAIDPTRRDQYLIPGGMSGASLLANGLFVLLKKVPTTDGAWATESLRGAVSQALRRDPAGRAERAHRPRRVCARPERDVQLVCAGRSRWRREFLRAAGGHHAGRLGRVFRERGQRAHLHAEQRPLRHDALRDDHRGEQRRRAGRKQRGQGSRDHAGSCRRRRRRRREQRRRIGRGHQPAQCHGLSARHHHGEGRWQRDCDVEFRHREDLRGGQHRLPFGVLCSLERSHHRHRGLVELHRHGRRGSGALLSRALGHCARSCPWRCADAVAFTPRVALRFARRCLPAWPRGPRR